MAVLGASQRMGFGVHVITDEGDGVQGVRVVLVSTSILRGRTAEQYTDSHGHAGFDGYDDRGIKVFVGGSHRAEHDTKSGQAPRSTKKHRPAPRSILLSTALGASQSERRTNGGRMRTRSDSGFIIARLATAALLFWALARHPYGYYTILRWVTCGVSAYAVLRAIEISRTGWAWALAILAIVFNPIVPVHLDRRTWAPVDVAAAIILLATIPALRRDT